jgi:hypothetical protein
MKIALLFASILVLLLSSENVCAQRKQWKDDVWILSGKKELSAPLFRKWKPEVQFDGRSTVVTGNNVQLAGVRVGLEHKRVHRFGLGIYNWSSPISTEIINNVGDTEDRRYTFGYGSIYYERILFFSRKWEFASTLHLGNGRIKVQTRPSGTDEFNDPLEVSTSGFYNITWWLSVGGGIGYRFMRNAPQEVDDAFEAPVYVAKVKIRITKMLRCIFNADVKNEY